MAIPRKGPLPLGQTLPVLPGYTVNSGNPISQARVGGANASGALPPPWTVGVKAWRVGFRFEASPGRQDVSVSAVVVALSWVLVYFCFLPSFIVKLSGVDIR